MQITTKTDMASSDIPSPDVARLLAPLLPALPAAASSTRPAVAVLPILSPILRQRVQILSSASTEPWLRLLCYDTAKAAKLGDIVRGGSLEPHPVSGEIEVDWESDTEIRYRRLDRETLQALVAILSLALTFQLVYCVGDQDGGGDGWRVGEVSVADTPSPFASFGGHPRIEQAEREFEESNSRKTVGGPSSTRVNGNQQPADDGDDDDDDGYWDRYDATPSRTPAVKRSPAPRSTQTSQFGSHLTASAEDAYFAQYDSVQPAMDNHDPDEAKNVDIAPPLGLGRVTTESNGFGHNGESHGTNGTWAVAEPPRSPSVSDDERAVDLAHPRPESSASSNGSQMIARLEETAGKQEQSEFGVKQHISRSIRSLFLLSRASGIDREEFERMVRTELDVLGMIEDAEE